MEDDEIVSHSDLSMVDVHRELRKEGLDLANPMLNSLIADFSDLIRHLRSDPKKFRHELANLRKKALEPFNEYPELYQDDISKINSMCYLLTVYTDPIASKQVELINRQNEMKSYRRRKNIEWGVEGVGAIAKSTIKESIKHGIPVSMIAIGAHKLLRASEIIGAALDTVNSYANDPFGRCAMMNKPRDQYMAQLKEYESMWFKSWRNLEKPEMFDGRETGFFTTLTDSVLCTLPSWTTGVAGNVARGGAEISGALTSTFAAFVIFLMGVMLWILLNKEVKIGIPFLFYLQTGKDDNKIQIEDKKEPKGQIVQVQEVDFGTHKKKSKKSKKSKKKSKKSKKVKRSKKH